jgi:hypothetical protein
VLAKPGEDGPYKKSSRAVLFSEIMAIMGWFSETIDQLPAWVKIILLVFTLLGSVYYIAGYGVFSFLLHVIFSPVP